MAATVEQKKATAAREADAKTSVEVILILDEGKTHWHKGEEFSDGAKITVTKSQQAFLSANKLIK